MDNEVPENNERKNESIDRIRGKLRILDKGIECFFADDGYIEILENGTLEKGTDERELSRMQSLKRCYEEMLEKGITDEKLIFNLGEILTGKVCGVCGADKGYSYDKITADYIEIYNFKGDRFKISADGDKVKITKMY